MDADISSAINVFLKLVKNRAERLQHGAKLRNEMHNIIDAGKQPTGYRAEWLKESAAVLIHVLGQIAEDFDDKHADDKASISDLLDVTATAMGSLRKEAGFDDEDD